MERYRPLPSRVDVLEMGRVSLEQRKPVRTPWHRPCCIERDGLRDPALLLDIKVQNGSIRDVVKAQIRKDFVALQPSGDANTDEVARLRIIANRRAEAANPKWVEDVRARKLAIATGEGAVHGRHYDLQEQYGLGLTAA